MANAASNSTVPAPSNGAANKRRPGKTATQQVEEANLSSNERILRRCYDIYDNPEKGLVKIAKSVGISLLVPRKKVLVLMIGNHSAGKSSFINWYIEEHVQRTGVAIETQGFCLITNGKRRETLTGNATLHLYPHLEPLRAVEGIVDYLTTEISTSQAKKFNLVTFLDTPGLVDGDMSYPFDVNKAIKWIGDLADLIFVFFDPIGQALCKRTVNLVEALHESHADKIRFYLSKADEAGPETDRQRVMMQIVQELCKRKGLNRTCFDMPTIYVPSLAVKPGRCVNQIDEVTKEVEKTINATIQNTLNTLERDCDNIASRVDQMVAEHTLAASANIRRSFKRYICNSCAFFVPLWVAMGAIFAAMSHQRIESYFGKDAAHLVNVTMLQPVNTLTSLVPIGYTMHAIGVLVGFILLTLCCGTFGTKPLPTLSRRDRQQLITYRDYVQKIVKPQKQELYSEYLKQSSFEFDD